LGKAQIYGWVKLVNGIINLPLIIGFLITIQIKQTMKNLHRFKKPHYHKKEGQDIHVCINLSVSSIICI
jgi:hypothetical protein